MDLFFQPKICWKAVGKNLTFAVVESGVFLTAPASFISANKFNDYITAFLCSNVAKYFIYKNSDTTGAGDIMLNIQSLIKFPVPIPDGKLQDEIEKVVSSISHGLPQENQGNQEQLNDMIYSLYQLSKQEITYIENV